MQQIYNAWMYHRSLLSQAATHCNMVVDLQTFMNFCRRIWTCWQISFFIKCHVPGTDQMSNLKVTGC